MAQEAHHGANVGLCICFNKLLTHLLSLLVLQHLLPVCRCVEGNVKRELRLIGVSVAHSPRNTALEALLLREGKEARARRSSSWQPSELLFLLPLKEAEKMQEEERGVLLVGCAVVGTVAAHYGFKAVRCHSVSLDARS
jgi:hypothetical protein